MSRVHFFPPLSTACPPLVLTGWKKRDERDIKKKARARKRVGERKRAQSALYLLFFLEARDLINRITQGLMKSELPSHLRLYTRPSHCSCYVKTEIFPGNTFPPPTAPFTLPASPLPDSSGESRGLADSEREINSEIDKFVSTNFSSYAADVKKWIIAVRRVLS